MTPATAASSAPGSGNTVGGPTTDAASGVPAQHDRPTRPGGVLSAGWASTARVLPGLAVAAVAVATAWAGHRLLPEVPMLTMAVALGVLAANAATRRLAVLPAATRPGLGFAGKRLMRLGVVLLGLKLAVGDILDLGAATLAATLGVVAITFAGTRWLGRRLGLPGDQPLLIATGFSICGASAVAAMNGVTDSDDDDVTTAVALVTLCGSLAIVVLPLLGPLLGLHGMRYGTWVGASVHDVGQVVAAAQPGGGAAVHSAVVVKLLRVLMLAPLVAGASVTIRRQRATRAGAPHHGSQTGQTPAAARRPALVPLFVVGFVAATALRSTGWLPDGLLEVASTAQELVLAAAMFGLGTAVDVRRLARTGGRALALGFGSWALVAVAAYAAVRLTTP